MSIYESDVELEMLGWFEDLGYEVIPGPELAPDGSQPERKSYKHVLLEGRMHDALHRLNPDLPPAAIADAVGVMLGSGTPGLLTGNREFQRRLTAGVQVYWRQDGETKGGRVRLADFTGPEKNDWLVVNQFTVTGTTVSGNRERRPDAVVFLNGMPVAVFELKNPATENADVWAAYRQLQTYKEEIPELFRTNGVLIASDGVYVLCDEAHRSQYGIKARINKEGETVYGYAKYLRDAVPNATFVAFTGTPIAAKDKDTRGVFGDYVDIYDIEQAVKDKATVPIYFESRLVKLEMESAVAAALDEEVDELMEDEDETARARTKSRWAALESLVKATPRMETIAADLVQHFETRQDAMRGKAMVVCMSREVCALLYAEIEKLRPQWHDADPEKGAIKVVMTGSASDREMLRQHVHTAKVKKRLEKRFKDPADPLKIVIVRDMWLTGFDVPCLTTMYVDKPMKDHNLMQAIARVNRVFRDKPGGLVVDYIGIANELKLALQEYTQSKGQGRPTVPAEEMFLRLKEEMEVAWGMLHGLDYSNFRVNALKPMRAAADHILGLDNGKRRFADCVLRITQAFALCCTLPAATEYRDEIAFFQAVRTILTKSDPTKALSDDAKEHALRQIISRAVVSAEVMDIFGAAGLQRPDVGILSDEFLEDVRKLKERNLAVEVLERLLKGQIRSKFATNVVQSRKFSELLQDSLTRYRNRAIETAQVIEELIAMAKQFQAAANRGEQLGLSADEMAFYDALAANEASVRELGDETLRRIAVELTTKLRASNAVDWYVRESVRAKLRLMVKTVLKKWKYPPDGQDAATETVLDQAKELSAAWAAA
jgi:type I restriction enzyme, R subunit